MIDRSALLKDLKTQVKALENDLLEQTAEDTELGSRLRQEYAEARSAGRTGWSDKQWIDDRVAQAAVAWILACVFVRFLEDNRLLDLPAIAGPGDRMRDAVDAKDAHFRSHPGDSDREYLLAVFEQIAKYPATEAVFDRRHNALWQIPISGDAARELIGFFRRIDPDRDNALVHDFTDEALDTRFLGDLYQDLSEHAKKTYALLQTPEFVEEFILDRTLDPAIEEFGLEDVRMIDPTCGSGHFLIGAYQRLLVRWRAQEPGTNVRELVQRALHAVHGVDINPFAVAIAKFRLMIAAIRDCGVSKLADAPRFELNLAVGDSLLHGHTTGALDLGSAGAKAGSEHFYETEDAEAARAILNQRYHAVVGNPPYITPKDPGLKDAYRSRFLSCYKEYALSAPFMERFWDLAESGDQTRGAGYVGKITASAMFLRKFGEPLVTKVMPTLDVTHVIDTSGAAIPGHGTSTVIIFGRSRRPAMNEVSLLVGYRGEPRGADIGSAGQVWQSIVHAIDRPGFTNSFVGHERVHRDRISSHPVSLASERVLALIAKLNSASEAQLDRHLQTNFGTGAQSNCDDVLTELGGPSTRYPHALPYFTGNHVRDWSAALETKALFPYCDGGTIPYQDLPPAEARYLWPFRTTLGARATFSGGTYRSEGRAWWGWHQYSNPRIEDGWKLSYAATATHNHFVLLQAPAVVNRWAPTARLSDQADVTLARGLLAVLNSSTAAFWLRQCTYPKDRSPEPWMTRHEFDTGTVDEFPVPANARRLEALAEAIERAIASTQLTESGDAVLNQSNLAGNRRAIALQCPASRCVSPLSV